MDVLLKKRATAEAKFEKLDAQVVSAIAKSRPMKEIAELRKRRRDALEEVDDLGEALRLTEDQLAKAEARKRQEKTKALVSEANELAHRFIETSAAVDAALAELERAAVAYRLTAMDLASGLRRAGLTDGGRIGRMASPHSRWSAWKSAPTWCELAEVARTSPPRRETLKNLSRRIVPSFPEKQ